MATVETGLMEGKTLPSGVRAWFGVPYAAPPVRELRWRAPQPPAKWGGPFRADRFAPMCLQPLRNRTMNHYFGNEATSEDCLYLNIWAPKDPAPAGKPYPVLVWVYGGGFNIGSASMANYAGEGLAKKGVIQINIAYRVGTLGFFAHPDLTTEGAGASGNYGLLDQIAALKWVQRNVSALGGDPNNVTLAGQSAGSMSVALLQASPLAKGLFHRVIGMSGSPFGDLLTPVPLAEAEADGVRFASTLGASDIEVLRDMSGDRIAAASFTRKGPITIDGRVLDAAPVEIFAAGRHSQVPAMLGFTRDEAFRALGPAHTVAEFEDAVRKAFPATASAVLKTYRVKSDADVARAVSDVQRDSSLGLQMSGWAKAQNAPTWAWFFTRRQPYVTDIRFSDHDPATAGAYHTGDVPYWLGTLDALNMFRTTRDWEPSDRKLADAMSSMIVSFASGKAPTAEWPRFDANAPKVLELGEEVQVIDWPNFKALDSFKGAQSVATSSETRRLRD
jgi:para-nitrobenzyl esterase